MEVSLLDKNQEKYLEVIFFFAKFAADTREGVAFGLGGA